MLHSRVVVRSHHGEVLGIFPAPIADHAALIRALLAAHPRAEVNSVVTTDAPCRDHPAYEADKLPGVRTSLNPRRFPSASKLCGPIALLDPPESWRTVLVIHEYGF